MKKKLSIKELIEENNSLREENEHIKRKISMSNAAFLNIVGKSLDGIFIVDVNKMVLYTNYAAIKLFDRNISDLLGEPLKLDIDLDEFFSNSEMVEETFIEKSDKSKAIVEVSAWQTEWNNNRAYVISFRDITERKKSEELFEYMSQHDYLTDLPNRLLFEKHLAIAIDSAEYKNQHMALLYIDIDDFKMVNDTLGHDIGDLLLQQVSNILKNITRSGDTVCRLGGDEFAVILSELNDPDYPSSFAESILKKFREIFCFSGQEIYANVSIGIAIYPISGQTSLDIVKNADSAMYSAKRLGKNQYCCYKEGLNEYSEINLQIASGLRSGIKNKEFFLEYQPIIDINTTKCCGIEALLRWKNPSLGLVPPDKFIPFAERSGIMPYLSQFIISQAIQDYSSLNSEQISFISLNMSANELNRDGTAILIDKELKQNKLPPEHLILELTETVVMLQPKVAIKKLNTLSDMGVKIAVDDFGTGYSCLAYLKDLPLYILKIDRSFINDIGKDDNDEIIIKSTIQLAHNLNFKVVAEGVETKEQLDFLKEHHCDYIQGFYYSKSLSLQCLQDYISKEK
ncbi:MAG: bifunctional diguanylate cyclase/phosphodiesterase [Legionellaceae bacterium]|nr:bifunctional diguanylate cyclase/phosphodiesterase [Legionellaceae bacterium]